MFWRFIYNFTGIAHPLNKRSKKGTPDTLPLNDKQRDAIKDLIKKVCSPPVLTLPRVSLPYTLDCDASDYRVGCAFFQTNPDGGQKPIGVWSRSLLQTEENYSSSERECLAVVWAFITMKLYLMYERFSVFTDHATLHWLSIIDDPSVRLIR